MPLPANVTPITVTALTTRIKLRLEEHFPGGWVTGEVSNFTRATSGHVYFTSEGREGHDQVRHAARVRPAVEVRPAQWHGGRSPRVASASSSPAASTNCTSQELQPKGVGAAELAPRHLKEKLLKKGYFDPKRKRPLPKYPRRVALDREPHWCRDPRHATNPDDAVAARGRDREAEPRAGGRRRPGYRRIAADAESVTRGPHPTVATRSCWAAAGGVRKTSRRSTRRSSPTRSTSVPCRSCRRWATRVDVSVADLVADYRAAHAVAGDRGGVRPGRDDGRPDRPGRSASRGGGTPHRTGAAAGGPARRSVGAAEAARTDPRPGTTA